MLDPKSFNHEGHEVSQRKANSLNSSVEQAKFWGFPSCSFVPSHAGVLVKDLFFPMWCVRWVINWCEIGIMKESAGWEEMSAESEVLPGLSTGRFEYTRKI